LRGDTRKKITIPAIGMGLWKADPYMVLKKLRNGKIKSATLVSK